MTEEEYIEMRLEKAEEESKTFEKYASLPINKKKIVFTTIEGTTGYTCNPKYIAEELLRRGEDWEMVWLVNDIGKKFPDGIKKVENTLENRAYHLSTAGFWIDNSRKQLEVRKRPGQIYIQTWHAKLGFKPTCLDRGKSFSKIAYLVSKHDSDMIDYVLSNSQWYDDTLPTGMLYDGPTLRYGSPRCDILVNRTERDRERVRQQFRLPHDAKIIMYAPTFRGGSQSIDRILEEESHAPDYGKLMSAMERRFGSTWYVFLRLHPQMTARHIENRVHQTRLIDISKVDDMYELLAGCDAFMTDYSSAAFDAALMYVPIFLYADDYVEYENERGSLLWDLRKLPFLLAENDEQLEEKIGKFEDKKYQEELTKLFDDARILEDGRASARVVDFIFEKFLMKERVL